MNTYLYVNVLLCKYTRGHNCQCQQETVVVHVNVNVCRCMCQMLMIANTESVCPGWQARMLATAQTQTWRMLAQRPRGRLLWLTSNNKNDNNNNNNSNFRQLRSVSSDASAVLLTLRFKPIFSLQSPPPHHTTTTITMTVWTDTACKLEANYVQR